MWPFNRSNDHAEDQSQKSVCPECGVGEMVHNTDTGYTVWGTRGGIEIRGKECVWIDCSESDCDYTETTLMPQNTWDPDRRLFIPIEKLEELGEWRDE